MHERVKAAMLSLTQEILIWNNLTRCKLTFFFMCQKLVFLTEIKGEHTTVHPMTISYISTPASVSAIDAQEMAAASAERNENIIFSF